MQILIPIASQSPFYPEEEYFFPKPLIEVAGRPMIEIVIGAMRKSFPEAKFVFTADTHDIRRFSLDKTLKLAAGEDSVVVEKFGETNGALCSCLLCIGEIDWEEPLIVCNSDQIITENVAPHVKRFESENVEAGVLTFDSVHPRWSYVMSDQKGEVIQAFEKQVVSRDAIAGFYYFKSAKMFFEGAQAAILKDANFNGAYYISASINELILTGGSVRSSKLGPGTYHNFYAPTRIREFERTPQAQSLRSSAMQGGYNLPVNVIIPAAGMGSRFANADWKKPKPFIDVDGQPMLKRVIENVLPTNGRPTVLIRDEHRKEHQELVSNFADGDTEIVGVAELTEGTACTVLLARSIFDNDSPMMVANSDQYIDFDVNEFVDDCERRGLDGSILVFRDPSKDPKWSFAKIDDDGLVTEVAEKKPISDLATVGVYLFSRGRDFVGAATDMIARNDRVNNEFYTCPVYNYMIKQGLRIGVYEVEMSAMHGLGTPEDLEIYLKGIGAPRSQDAPS